MPRPPPAPDPTSTKEEDLTLADHFLYFRTLEKRRELEDFRIKYEAEFGETDLTLHYTCTWPMNQQEWLITHHPKRYWDGLPPFVQAFLKNKMRAAGSEGRLDDKPDAFLRLFLTGQMNVKDNGPRR